MFSLSIDKPDVLYSKVVEIPERVTLEAWTENKQPQEIFLDSDPTLVKGVTGEVVRILQPIGTPFILNTESCVYFSLLRRHQQVTGNSSGGL